MSEHEPHNTDDAESTTTVLQRVSPGWAWVRHNFTLPALLTIATIVAGAASYILTLRTRVAVLEQETAGLERDIAHMAQVAPDQAAIAALTQRVEDHDGRLTRLESDWDHAREEVGKEPLARFHKRGR